MKCVDRSGNYISELEGQDNTIRWLYCTPLGRGCLKVLVRPWVSKLGGWFLSTPPSKAFIKGFVSKNHIDMKQYEEKEYKSYNDFFIRKIKTGERKISTAEDVFVSPCDSKLSVYDIDEDLRFVVKNTEYSLYSLIRNSAVAEEYNGGQLMIFRLAVDDYHHYCFVDNGYCGKNHRINGCLNTVNPIAGEERPIYKENSREWSRFNSENFGELLYVEVGALMVGKIVNIMQEQQAERGEEKGYFEFGGSTVIICAKKDKIKIDADILENSANGLETKVEQGEKIGLRAEALSE